MQGEFKSIMAIVTPCRSDLSAGGLARTAHLSDGRLKLVLVRRCSVLQYLRLLARIPTLGKFSGLQGLQGLTGKIEGCN